MNMPVRLLCAPLMLAGVVFSLPAVAGSSATVTRSLQQTLDVPAGGSVAVDNLVGHLRVAQGNGPLRIDATVVAGGDHAQALAQSVKLDVSTSGKQVRVHVDYPVDSYDTFRYNPSDARSGDSGELCLLGKFICFHDRSSSHVSYQGRRVRVNQSASGGSGAPLYVDVVVHLPAHVSANLSNAVGLLEADGLTDDLGLNSEGGDIHAQDLNGRLSVHTAGGDAYLSKVTSSDVSAHTAGGDANIDGLNGDLNLATGGGDVHLQKLQGPLDLHSAGGDVHLDGAASTNAQIQTGGGDLTGTGLSGNFRIATAGGDVKLDTVSGPMSLETAGGDARMTGDLSKLSSLGVTTGGGDLNVAGDLAALASLKVSSGEGHIAFRVGQLSMHLDAVSSGGDIQVHMPDMRNVSSSSDRLDCDLGGATGSGTLRSDGGDITLAQLSSSP